MRIEQMTAATEELMAATQRLVPQLTNKRPPTEPEMAALVGSECISLLVARADAPDSGIMGMACIAVYRVPTGVRGIIEDVVVDASVRGQGIGEALTRRCLEIAQQKGAASVTLTSNAGRAAANRLYTRMGFQRRDTNSYIYKFT